MWAPISQTKGVRSKLPHYKAHSDIKNDRNQSMRCSAAFESFKPHLFITCPSIYRLIDFDDLYKYLLILFSLKAFKSESENISSENYQGTKLCVNYKAVNVNILINKS